MTYIPDIRNKVKEPLTPLGKREENAYYEGILNDLDANYIAGYDWAVDDTLEAFFYNLDIYQDELEECGFDDVRLEKFSQIYADFATNEEFDLDEVEDTQIRLILTLINSFLDYAEMERDELGVSLIEDMDEDEYEECKERYESGYKNVLLRIAARKAEQRNKLQS